MWNFPLFLGFLCCQEFAYFSLLMGFCSVLWILLSLNLCMSNLEFLLFLVFISAVPTSVPSALAGASRLMGEQDDLMRAIAMSLGENIVIPSSSTSVGPPPDLEPKPSEPKPDPEADEEELPDEEYEALSTEVGALINSEISI